jgi:hypothetical protein
MVERNTNGDEPRLVLTGGGSSARVVLAEVDAPGSLHYLLEAEGFQVVGCAGDDEELARVLGQGLRPDVIVLDADIAVTASVIARELAPESHLIAIWPDDVQPPPGGERISPRQVYEELGPAIRRHMDRRSVAVPVIALPMEEPAMASVAPAAVGVGVLSGAGLASGSASSGVFTRAASRVSVLSVTLITAILLTMGVSFALGGFRSSPPIGPPRFVVPGLPDVGGVAGSADPSTGRAPSGSASGPSGNKPPKHGSNGPDHHNAAGGFSGVVVTTGTGDGGSSGDQTGGQGDQGTGQGDQGTGQGDQGGGQGDQGGGQGDQGDHGGGQGDHGNGDGQHGGNGQGDQDDDDQGENDQGDGHGDQDGDDQDGDDEGEDHHQGEDDQGDQHSHGDQTPHGDGHGDGHGSHTDQQGQDEGN